MQKMLNFTPHKIVLMKEKTRDVIVCIEPQGMPIRLNQQSLAAEPVVVDAALIPCVGAPHYTGVAPMPPADSSIIVSALVAEYLMRAHPTHCRRIFSPDTSPGACVRDDQGRIIGTTRLVRYK